MIPKIVGLDLSLTATGAAAIQRDAAGLLSAHTITIPSSGERGARLATRRERLATIATTVLSWCAGAGLAVLEGPAFSARDGHVWDRAGLWWAVVDQLNTADIPVAVAAPTTLKKFATGKGTANKTAVAAAVTRLWPDAQPGNDNEFDALVLAIMGAQWAGLDVPTRAHHAEVLSKVEWPPDPGLSGTGSAVQS
ncbi:MAG: hypothetical protein ACJ72N_07040 [Labedaea sp.]